MYSLSQDSPPVAVINTLAAVALVSSDSDLLDAAISELQAIPAGRVVTEDPESHVPLVLSTNALVRSLPEEAISALQTALHMVPTDHLTRNRLAKLLIANEKVEEAVELLNVDFGGDVRVKSEGMRLRGVAKILAGVDGGLSDLVGAVRVCPWEVKGMEGVAWGRKILDELKE
jgi:superkiller protein 3